MKTKSGSASRLIAFVAILALFTHQSAQSALIAHWNFDEGSGTTVRDSVGAFTGTLSSSGVQFVPGGVAGSALRFDKAHNGYVDFGNVLPMTNGDYSIVLWIKMTAGDTTDSSIMLSKHQSGYQNGYFFNVNASAGPPNGENGKVLFYDSPNGGHPYLDIISHTTVNDGNWHQVASVHSGDTDYLYVDGNLEGSQPGYTIVPNGVNFLLGGINFDGIPAGMFSGWVDEVEIYDHALGTNDVTYLFNHPNNVVQDCGQMNAALMAQLNLTETINADLKKSSSKLVGTMLSINAKLIRDLSAANANNTATRTELARAKAANARLQTQLNQTTGIDLALRGQMGVISNSLTDLTIDFRRQIDPRFNLPGASESLQVSNVISALEQLNSTQLLNYYQTLSTNSGRHTSGF